MSPTGPAALRPRPATVAATPPDTIPVVAHPPADLGARGGGLPPPQGYQHAALTAITASLADGGRGQVEAACGTGKTLLAVHTAVRLCPTGLVVLACPSLALIAQTLPDWTTTGVTRDVLVVCSDPTAADDVADLADLSSPVTTDPHTILDWLGQPPTGRLRLILVTHLSTDLVARALTATGQHADLLLIDEAHITAGTRDKHVALVHDNTALPAHRRVYLTATRRVLGARQRRRGTTIDEVYSMDDPAVYGPVLYRYPFGSAIADGWLDDYQVLVIGVTCTEVLHLLRDADAHTVLGHHDAPLRTVVVQAAIARAAAEYGLRRILVFTDRIADSQEFTRTLPRTIAHLPADLRPPGVLSARHVDGDQDGNQRRAALADLADPPHGGWTVLSNARCLSIGVNVPAVDGVAFARTKRSPIDIIQSVGRALRRNVHGTGVATILVPVLLPDDPDHIPTNLGEWETLFAVLRALRAHDSALAADLDTQRCLGATGDTARLPDRVVIRLPDGFDTTELLDHITLRVLQETTSDWLTGYAHAKAFHHTHGHLRVPPGYPTTGAVNLYQWVRRQVSAHHAGQLSTERVAALTALGLDWDPLETAWQRNYAIAEAFHTTNGHLRVPPGHHTDGLNLYHWIRSQTQSERRGQLPPHRRRALDRLGIEWDPIGQAWQRGLAYIRQFYTTHGHLMIPDKPVDGFNPNQWLNSRRHAYRTGTLSAHHREALQAIHPDWHIPHGDWTRGHAAAVTFHTAHGHLNVPEGTIIDGIDLHSWLRIRRRAHAAGRLDPELQHALETLGIAWNPRQAAWWRNLAIAAAYQRREHHLRPPDGHREHHLHLYIWLLGQRSARRRHKLTTDQIAALDAIGMDWAPARGRRAASNTPNDMPHTGRHDSPVSKPQPMTPTQDNHHQESHAPASRADTAREL